MWGTEMAIEKMHKQKGGNGGVIINIASMAGKIIQVCCKKYRLFISPFSGVLFIIIFFKDNFSKYASFTGIEIHAPISPYYTASKFGVVAASRSMYVSNSILQSCFHRNVTLRIIMLNLLYF